MKRGSLSWSAAVLAVVAAAATYGLGTEAVAAEGDRDPVIIVAVADMQGRPIDGATITIGIETQYATSKQTARSGEAIFRGHDFRFLQQKRGGLVMVGGRVVFEKLRKPFLNVGHTQYSVGVRASADGFETKRAVVSGFSYYQPNKRHVFHLAPKRRESSTPPSRPRSQSSPTRQAATRRTVNFTFKTGPAMSMDKRVAWPNGNVAVLANLHYGGFTFVSGESFNGLYLAMKFLSEKTGFIRDEFIRIARSDNGQMFLREGMSKRVHAGPIEALVRIRQLKYYPLQRNSRRNFLYAFEGSLTVEVAMRPSQRTAAPSPSAPQTTVASSRGSPPSNRFGAARTRAAKDDRRSRETYARPVPRRRSKSHWVVSFFFLSLLGATVPLARKLERRSLGDSAEHMSVWTLAAAHCFMGSVIGLVHLLPMSATWEGRLGPSLGTVLSILPGLGPAAFVSHAHAALPKVIVALISIALSFFAGLQLTRHTEGGAILFWMWVALGIILSLVGAVSSSLAFDIRDNLLWHAAIAFLMNLAVLGCAITYLVRRRAREAQTD